MLFVASNKARSGICRRWLAVAAMPGSAHGSVISASLSLPLIGVSYTSPTGAGCFTAEGVCITLGTFVQTSVTSVFLPVQDIAAEATYHATLTPLVGDTPLGSVALSGTVDETVIGQTSNTETGSFTTEITALDLTGALALPGSQFNGVILDLALGGSDLVRCDEHHARGGLFKLGSFFDVFVDVSLVGTGFSKSVGPIQLVAVAVPEPSIWTMLVLGFAGLGFAGCRGGAKPRSREQKGQAKRETSRMVLTSPRLASNFARRLVFAEHHEDHLTQKPIIRPARGRLRDRRLHSADLGARGHRASLAANGFERLCWVGPAKNLSVMRKKHRSTIPSDTGRNAPDGSGRQCWVRTTVSVHRTFGAASCGSER